MKLPAYYDPGAKSSDTIYEHPAKYIGIKQGPAGLYLPEWECKICGCKHRGISDAPKTVTTFANRISCEQFIIREIIE